jgi:SagB-type dehydrogenase family enzyme
MISHRAVVNAILDTNRRFHLGPHDRVAALAPLHHDMSVYDIFGILAAGGTVVMPEASGVRDPAHWAELISEKQVTVWNSVPAMMEMFVEYVTEHSELHCESLRLAFLGGDWIPLTLPDGIKVLFPDIQVVSVGGPTESTLWNIFYPIKTLSPGIRSIPYGRPIANAKYYVLDHWLEHRPTWVPGKLYCAGVGLAKGYWRDEEKTASSFVYHPGIQERLYRTGDLGRYLPDGNIEFLGREDFQVKIRGYRVELAEIEFALASCPGVRTAIVTATSGVPDEKRLIAYIVPSVQPSPSQTSLRSFLQQKLPDYMIPSSFVAIDELPLNASGKIDRRALPPPPKEVESKTPADHGNIVGAIDGIVAGVLKLNTVDWDVNLLSLGATSLDMIRVANRLEKELSFRPKIDEFYADPTVRGLSRAYERARTRAPSAPSDRTLGPGQAMLSYELILDPEERSSFKEKQPGLRRLGDKRAYVELGNEAFSQLTDNYVNRQSCRRFSSAQITFAAFSAFLDCLRQIRVNGAPKYLYPSGGGLYPVQTYLYLKPGRVAGVPSGTHYYHPVYHRLVVLTPNAKIEGSIYSRLINRPVFESAAFAIFLVAQFAAIGPLYGDRSAEFATLEAGYMSQLLMMHAPFNKIGLCPIGTVDFNPVRHLFLLEQSHVLLHSLLGGATATPAASPLQQIFSLTESRDPEWEEGEI